MIFKNKYGEPRSGWPLFISVALMFIVQILLGTVIGIISMLRLGLENVQNNMAEYMEATTRMAESPFVMYISYSLLIGAFLLLFWLFYKRSPRRMGFYTAGWAKQLGFGGLFGVVCFTAAVLVLLATGASKAGGFNAGGALSGLFWAGLVHYIFVGFLEETQSRGLMMTALKTTRNKWVIVLLPSVLFGLLHILNDNVTVFSLLNIALVGVLFSYLFIKTGRLWAPIGFHITWNFVQGYIFGIPVSGGAIPKSALMTVTPTGPEWLTGGAFGVEGGAACTLVIILGLVFTHFCVKRPENPDEYWTMDNDLPLVRGKAGVENTVAGEAVAGEITSNETAVNETENIE